MTNRKAISIVSGPGAFRLILAMVVFVHHLSSLALGGAAVYSFFSISGYWIHRMWTTRYSQANNPYLTYMVSRSWRLIPTFALIAVITFICSNLLFGISSSEIVGDNDPYHFIISNILIIGYNGLQPKLMGPAWSLDIEMQFYIIAPLLAIFVNRKISFIIISIIVSLLSLINFGTSYISTFMCFFAAGMVASHSQWRPSSILVFGALTAVFIAIVLLILSDWRGVIVGGARPGPLFSWNEFANITIAVLIFPLAMRSTKMKGGNADTALGDLSFIVYLLHWVGVQWQAQYRGSILDRLPFAAASMVLVFAASIVIWFFFDRPINRWRAEWVGGRLARANRPRTSPYPGH